MNSRLESLINRGYSRDIVMKLASFTDEELDYASQKAFEHLSKNCTSVENPRVIFIGGQPGSGKTIMSMNLKNEIENIVEIGIDNYRMYHPRYLQIEKVIREFWMDKKETINSSPGNDIADFTHYFAGAMTDKLMEKARKNNYNLLLEWGMREPTAPLKSMSEFKENGYTNIVLFVAAHKDVSYNACNLRSDIMKNSSRIIRKIPKNFHDACIDTLPSSINEIYRGGYSNSIIDYMLLTTRNNEILWDDKSEILPGSVYESYINNGDYSYDDNNSTLAYKANIIEMQGLHSNINTLKQPFICINSNIFEAISKIK